MNFVSSFRRGLTMMFSLTSSLLLTSFAHASLTTSTVSAVLVWSNGNLVYVYPVGGIAGVPVCGAAMPYYSFSYSRPMASAYLAALLSAQARGATVTIYGTGTCTDQSISETLDYFSIN